MTDYACVVLEHLTQTREAKSASAIAGATGLPEPTVSKLLKCLSKTHLITSTRGANGGYKADKLASDISVLEIIEALEGRINFTECVDDTHECTIGIGCPLQGRWDPINHAIRNTLQDWTLADLSPPTKKQQVHA